MSLKIGSMFTGTAALDMAVQEVFDARPAWFCEYDNAPAKVLNHHYPTIPNHRDVTTINWAQVEPIDILTGGYPCQPFSAAGQRKGTDDDRHLWPYVREAIRHLRPRLTLLENVAGHRSLGFDRVLGDLAEIGCDAAWTSVRASDVGAPHHRERVFLAVVPADSGSIGLEAKRFPRRPAEEVTWNHDSYESLAGIGQSADIEHEIRLRWGDAAGRVMTWALIHGAPPPIIEDYLVRYIDEDLFGKRFPEVKPALNPEFSEWMMGLPPGWITNVPGLSRGEKLKMAGNGVVPQAAVAALRELLPLVEKVGVPA